MQSGELIIKRSEAIETPCRDGVAGSMGQKMLSHDIPVLDRDALKRPFFRKQVKERAFP